MINPIDLRADQLLIGDVVVAPDGRRRTVTDILVGRPGGVWVNWDNAAMADVLAPDSVWSVLRAEPDRA